MKPDNLEDKPESELTLKEKTDLLWGKHQDDKKKKPFRIPFMKRVSPAQAKKGYVTIMKIFETGAVDFERQQVKNNTITVDGLPRVVLPDNVCNFKGNPLVILEMWSIETLQPRDPSKFNDDEKAKRLAIGYRVLLEQMKLETLKKKTVGGILPWIIGGLVIAGLIYYLMGGKIA